MAPMCQLQSMLLYKVSQSQCMSGDYSLKMFFFLTVPQPSVFLTGGSVTIGSTATLQCNVTLQQYTIASYLSTPITLTVVLLKGTATLIVDSNPTGSGSVHTSVFTIPNVGVSNAGQYQCRATVNTTQNNVIDSNPGVSNTANLYILSK